MFASLFISWIIKSSFLPICSPSLRVILIWFKWLLNLIISSSTAALSDITATSWAILDLSISTVSNNSLILDSSFFLYVLGIKDEAVDEVDE